MTASVSRKPNILCWTVTGPGRNQRTSNARITPNVMVTTFIKIYWWLAFLPAELILESMVRYKPGRMALIEMLGYRDSRGR